MRRIEVNDSQRHVPRMKRRMAEAARRVLEAEGVQSYDLSLAAVEDRTISRLNQRFLDHRGTTDVLSFRLSEEGDTTLRGEVVVNGQQAARAAAACGVNPRGELLLYVVHGCLHLIGYDDGTAGAARRMHTRENELLAALGHPDGYGPLGEGL